MRSTGFVVPWLDPVDPADPMDVDGVLRRVKAAAVAGGSNGELLDAICHARTRIEVRDAEHHVARHTAVALLVLEIAVEWRMPAVERWAVAWLAAAGSAHLRLRWSSRARDGRFHSDGRASDAILAVAGSSERIVAGLQSGLVMSWDEGGAVTALGISLVSPVRTVAVRGDRVVAGGDQNAFVSIGQDVEPPPMPNRKDKLTASALGADGAIALGNEVGMVRVWTPGSDHWTPLPRLRHSPVIAVAFGPPAVGASVVRAMWAEGTAAEYPAATHARWHPLAEIGRTVGIAAWDPAGEHLAVTIGRSVHLAVPASVRLWTQDLPIRALAWSPCGHLASATEARIMRSTVPIGPDADRTPLDAITSDQLINNIAFLGEQFVVSTRGEQLARWAVSASGSDDPTFEAGDRITAVAVRTDDRQQVLVGSERGWIREYDAEGSVQRACRVVPAEVTAIAWDQSRPGTWVVSTLRGTFRVTPVDSSAFVSVRLSRDGSLCAVARAGQFAYGRDRAVMSSNDGMGREFPSRVRDICLDDAGSIAAIDETGLLRIRRGGTESECLVGGGARLLALDAHRGALIQQPGRLDWTGSGALYDAVPEQASAGAVFDHDRVAIADPGVAVLLAGPSPEQLIRTPSRASAVAAGPRRIIGASTTHIGGYDLVEPADAYADGSILLDVDSSDDKLYVTLPGGSVVLPADGLIERWEGESPTVAWLSEALFRFADVGDRLWHGGLDLAVDMARGADPDRPVRLKWRLDGGDVTAESVPWELLHRSAAPLGWFDDPPITSVRLVARSARYRTARRPTETGRPSMLVLRGIDDGMEKVDAAFERFRRRTRRTNLRLVGKPRPVGCPDELWTGHEAPIDILQIWAHCGPNSVRFAPGTPTIRHNVLAMAIGERLSPRLVVLVGCRSGALGRALIETGADAVVAMRVAVDDHTVQPLVEDFTARALGGEPIDLAFAGALQRYVHTGYPGAAAIPMLYLADNAEPMIFGDSRASTSEEHA